MIAFLLGLATGLLGLAVRAALRRRRRARRAVEDLVDSSNAAACYVTWARVAGAERVAEICVAVPALFEPDPEDPGRVQVRPLKRDVPAVFPRPGTYEVWLSVTRGWPYMHRVASFGGAPLVVHAVQGDAVTLALQDPALAFTRERWDEPPAWGGG